MYSFCTNKVFIFVFIYTNKNNTQFLLFFKIDYEFLYIISSTPSRHPVYALQGCLQPKDQPTESRNHKVQQPLY